MGKVVGDSLPPDLYDLLGNRDLEKKANKVIVFTTIDEDGFPRHGMLSTYEIFARDTKKLVMILYPTSKSTQNILRSGKVSFIVVDEDISYYIRAGAIQGPPLVSSPSEIFFEITVKDVINDKEPMVKITSGITFGGYPSKMEESRLKVFSELSTR